MSKVLIMSDNPGIPTGMGKVHKEIGRGLKKLGWDVVSLGWFTSAMMDKWKEWRVYATTNNYYGADIFDEVISREMPEIVLTIGDPWMVGYIADKIRCRSRFLFSWCQYVPIDGEAYGGGVPSTWNGMLRDADIVVAYTDYGKNAIIKSLPDLSWRMQMIPHGVDTSVFRPVSEEKRRLLRHSIGIPDDVVVFTMVARNQFRKNIPEFCKGWKKFKDTGSKKALFWPHMCFRDPMGWDLNEVFDIYDMKKDLVYLTEVAQSATNLDLVPEETLNDVYNIADVTVMLGGEGFGLPTLEAMACRKPVIAIKHSANTELVEGRGELVEVQNYITGAHSTERPVPSISDLADKLHLLYSNPKLRESYGISALEYAKTLTWDSVVKQWDTLLKSVSNPFSMEYTPETIC